MKASSCFGPILSASYSGCNKSWEALFSTWGGVCTFLRGGCPSSPSPSWRRFLVSVRVSGRCSEQVRLHLRWMISFLMESIGVLWKSAAKEKRIMVNKNVETKSLNSSVHPIIMDIWKQISRCSHSHPEPLFLHAGQELSGVWKPSHPFVCTFHSAPIPFACGSPEPIIRRTSHNFNYIFTVSKEKEKWSLPMQKCCESGPHTMC